MYHSVKTILLYGVVGWRIMKAKKNKLVAVEMDILGRSCRISRIKRIINERIMDMMKINETTLDDL